MTMEGNTEAVESQGMESNAPEPTQEITQETPGETRETGESAEPTEYTPNFTYKVGRDERQFPEYMQALIDSKEREEELRDIFTRADGLNFVKEKHEKLNQDYEELNSNYQQMQETNHKYLDFLQTQKRHIDNGDIDSFLRLNGLNRGHIENYLRREYELDEQGPEARQRYQKSLQAQNQAYQYQNQYQQLQNQYQQMQNNYQQMQLQMAMNKPEAAETKQFYDTYFGEGAFQGVVNAYINRNLSPEQAITQAIADTQNLPAFQKLAVQPQATVTPLHQPSKPQGSLPNLGRGRNASVVKKAPRTFEELKELARKGVD